MRISHSSGISIFTVAAALSVSGLLFGHNVEARNGRDDSIKLSGCLIRGEQGAGYLLTNAPGDPALFKADDHKVAPSAVGTSAGFATIFYWLYGNNELNEHVGQRVEIEADLQGDAQNGEIKTHRTDRWTEVEVKSSGQTMKARVPNGSFAYAADRGKESGGILIRRVRVNKVKMTGGCE
jgi:hypothetical protein